MCHTPESTRLVAVSHPQYGSGSGIYEGSQTVFKGISATHCWGRLGLRTEKQTEFSLLCSAAESCCSLQTLEKVIEVETYWKQSQTTYEDLPNNTELSRITEICIFRMPVRWKRNQGPSLPHGSHRDQDFAQVQRCPENPWQLQLVPGGIKKLFSQLNILTREVLFWLWKILLLIALG